jgi:two-component system, NarL family, sensor histidine kinase DevS
MWAHQQGRPSSPGTDLGHLRAGTQGPAGRPPARDTSTGERALPFHYRATAVASGGWRALPWIKTSAAFAQGEPRVESDSHRLLPQLRLDDLLAELQGRLQAVVATRDRVYALLEAVVAVGGSLNLELMLRQVVEAAVSLSGARYGALGVIGEGGELAEFIPVGLDEAQIAAIHHWPEGRGLLGELIAHPRPLRLADLSAHEKSYGFPAGHPPMRSFLGVPIRIRDEVYGNLYLTEKQGGGPFDEDDESVLVALAAAAGVAIENARLYEEARRQQRWLRATAEVTRQLLSGASSEQVLTLVAQQALEMSGADLVALAVPAADREQLVYTHAAGENAGSALGLVLSAETSLSGGVMAGGEAVTVEDFSSDPRVSLVAREHMRLGPAILLPLGAPGNVRGVLTVGREPGSPPLPPQAVDMVATFAAQAGIALELAEHRADAERLAVLQDRDRIGRDLHDLVIQRLYATGMSLQGAVPMIVRPEVADRVGAAVDALDETIREIRSAIFSLQSGSEAKRRALRGRILDVVGEMTVPLGFAPSLRLVGPLDDGVPDRASDHLLSALREALSNAARHSGGSKVEVAVECGDDLLLRVRDNGKGIAEGGRRSGLANLADRAAELGGTFTVRPGENGGTDLRWRVPLRTRARQPDR